MSDNIVTIDGKEYKTEDMDEKRVRYPVCRCARKVRGSR